MRSKVGVYVIVYLDRKSQSEVVQSKMMGDVPYHFSNLH